MWYKCGHVTVEISTPKNTRTAPRGEGEAIISRKGVIPRKGVRSKVNLSRNSSQVADLEPEQ